jgi:hypothetical protein
LPTAASLNHSEHALDFVAGNEFVPAIPVMDESGTYPHGDGRRQAVTDKRSGVSASGETSLSPADGVNPSAVGKPESEVVGNGIDDGAASTPAKPEAEMAEHTLRDEGCS